MSEVSAALRAAVRGEEVPAAALSEAINAILQGKAEEAEIAALAVALKIKGETIDELVTIAAALRTHAETVPLGLPAPVLDTCGTGGDGQSTFNISTLAAIVAAACGITVAKHGNRAITSRSGSADLLEALGLRLDLPTQRLVAGIRQLGIGFLFAPQHHQALRHAAAVRRQLPFPTFFNLLGPLSNPARATHQLLGVYDGRRLTQIATVVQRLGVQRAWVVHGHGGLDEVSPTGCTAIAEVDHGQLRTIQVEPEDFGLARIDAAEIAGGDAHHNAELARALLAGEPSGLRTAVVINAAAALHLCRPQLSLREAATRADAAIQDGAAADKLQQWIAWSKQ